MNLAEKPLEINRAEKSQLLRVPGIGLKGAEAILSARRTGRLNDLTSLRKLGIVVARAAPFLLLNGRRPESQLVMF
jgi:predicted DNA-binding helix-hairpin-helix protein